MAKIHTFKTTEYGKRVDCALYTMQTTKDVFWSPRWSGGDGSHGGCNSYVLCEAPQHDSYSMRAHSIPGHDGEPVWLASINGTGEVRWFVTKTELIYELQAEAKDFDNSKKHRRERLAAARHFGLLRGGDLDLLHGGKYEGQPDWVVASSCERAFWQGGHDLGTDYISDPVTKDWLGDLLSDARVPIETIESVLSSL